MNAFSLGESVRFLNPKVTKPSTKGMRYRRDRIADRAIGLGLVTVMATPFVLVVAATVIFGKAAIEAGSLYGAQIAGIARTVNDEIAPRVEDLREAYQGVADGVQRFQNDTRQALARLGNVPDVTIRRGQLGSTPSVRIVVPNRNFRIASADPLLEDFHRADYQLAQFGRGNPFGGNPFGGAPSVPNPSNALPSIELRTGSLLNQTLPSQAIPPRDLRLSSEPLRAALRPVADGFGQAVGVVQRPFNEAIQQTRAVIQPITALQNDIVALAGPLRQLGQALVMALALLAAALVVFIVTHVIAAVVIGVRRPAESGTAFLVSGPLGYVGFVGNRVRQEAFARLTGPRDTAPASLGEPMPVGGAG